MRLESITGQGNYGISAAAVMGPVTVSSLVLEQYAKGKKPQVRVLVVEV